MDHNSVPSSLPPLCLREFRMSLLLPYFLLDYLLILEDVQAGKLLTIESPEN